jgi:hypothetical protein
MALPRLPQLSPKLLVPVVAVAGGLGLTVLVWNQLQQIKQMEHQLTQSRSLVQQLETKNAELAQRAATLESENKSKEERNAALRNQLSTATTNLDRARLTLDELQERYDVLTQAHSQASEKLAAVSVEREVAQTKVAELTQEKSELERSASRLRERLTLLDRDYQQVAAKLAAIEAAPRSDVAVVSVAGPTPQGGFGGGMGADAPPASASLVPGTVELPPIIVRKDQAGMTMAVRGRLVEVSAPHNFIVVDKGTTDGVRVGMSFDVVRGSATVGRATVVRVRPNLSACDVVRSQTPGPLQAGDQAVQSGP